MKQLIIIIMTIIICSAIEKINAQPLPPGGPQHVNMLIKKLKLDESQAEKVRAIFKQTHEKLKAQREKMEAARDNDMEERERIMDEQDKQVVKLLNDEQKKKFEELKEEMPVMEHRGPGAGMRGPEGGPGRMEDREQVHDYKQ